MRIEYIKGVAKPFVGYAHGYIADGYSIMECVDKLLDLIFI
jgi:hypothetical protein